MSGFLRSCAWDKFSNGKSAPALRKSEILNLAFRTELNSLPAALIKIFKEALDEARTGHTTILPFQSQPDNYLKGIPSLPPPILLKEGNFSKDNFRNKSFTQLEEEITQASWS